MRVPQPVERAEAACLAAYGSRADPQSAERITADNRGLVRSWLIARGHPSHIVRTMPLGALRAAWRLHPETDTAKEPAMPEVTSALLLNGARKPVTDPMLALRSAIEAIASNVAPQAAPVDEASVKRIVAEAITAATIPHKLAITIDGKPTGELPASRHEMLETALKIVAQGLPLALIGPAGSGKTTACEQIAEALRLPFYLQGAASGAYEFLGFMDAHGHYQGTPFREAFEHGGVFLADEIDGSDPGALLVLNSALANGAMAFPDTSKPVKRHADFRMVAAANTYWSGRDRVYVGRNQLDATTLDRFAMLAWDYDEKLESAIAGNAEWTSYVQRARKAARELQIRHVISPRSSIMGAKLLAAGVARAVVEEATLWRGLDAEAVTKTQAKMRG